MAYAANVRGGTLDKHFSCSFGWNCSCNAVWFVRHPDLWRVLLYGVTMLRSTMAKGSRSTCAKYSAPRSSHETSQKGYCELKIRR